MNVLVTGHSGTSAAAWDGLAEWYMRRLSFAVAA